MYCLQHESSCDPVAFEVGRNEVDGGVYPERYKRN